MDTYEKRARLTPGLLAILPVTCTIITLALGKFPLFAALGALLTAAGGPFLLATIVGNFGRNAQTRLFQRWGGSPTTRALRLREPCDNPVQRDLWRTAVERLTGVTLHDAATEGRDPDGADQRISAATAQVLHLGQDGGVAAVRSENVAYGTERNIYGFRHLARGIATVCILVQIIAIIGPWDVSAPGCVLGALVCSGFLAFWILKPSEARTREAAHRYSRQLLIAAHNHQGTQT